MQTWDHMRGNVLGVLECGVCRILKSASVSIVFFAFNRDVKDGKCLPTSTWVLLRNNSRLKWCITLPEQQTFMSECACVGIWACSQVVFETLATWTNSSPKQPLTVFPLSCCSTRSFIIVTGFSRNVGFWLVVSALSRLGPGSPDRVVVVSQWLGCP